VVSGRAGVTVHRGYRIRFESFRLPSRGFFLAQAYVVPFAGGPGEGLQVAGPKRWHSAAYTVKEGEARSRSARWPVNMALGG